MVIHDIFAQNVWYFVRCASRLIAQKRVIFAKFLSQNTSKNLEILCQCEYASLNDLWQLMGTVWAWQNRHIRLGYALRRYFMTKVVWIGANFRDFKLIIGRINWLYCSPLFFISARTDSKQDSIAFISKSMWRQFNYYPALSSSWIRPEQETESYSIWPCLWR